MHRPHSAAKTHKQSVRLDVRRAITTWKLKAPEFHLHEVPGLFQKVEAPGSSFSDGAHGTHRVTGECRESPSGKSEVLCCSWGILKRENMLQTFLLLLSLFVNSCLPFWVLSTNFLKWGLHSGSHPVIFILLILLPLKIFLSPSFFPVNTLLRVQEIH